MKIEDIYGDLPTLETSRLILRKISLEDVKDLYSYASNEEVCKYVTWDTHKTRIDTEEYVKFVLNQYQMKKVAPWGIEYKENKTLIGTIDFVWWEPKHKTAEIGYILSNDYWERES